LSHATSEHREGVFLRIEATARTRDTLRARRGLRDLCNGQESSCRSTLNIPSSSKAFIANDGRLLASGYSILTSSTIFSSAIALQKAATVSCSNMVKSAPPILDSRSKARTKGTARDSDQRDRIGARPLFHKMATFAGAESPAKCDEILMSEDPSEYQFERGEAAPSSGFLAELQIAGSFLKILPVIEPSARAAQRRPSPNRRGFRW